MKSKTPSESRDSMPKRGSSRGPAGSMALRDGVWTAALFAVLFAVYGMAPNRYLSDAMYTLATSEAILAAGNPDLSRHGIRAPSDGRTSYRLQWQGGKLIHGYPPGSALLALPAVAVTRILLGWPVLDRGVYREDREIALGSFLAALTAAAAAAVFYRLARRDLRPGLAACASLAFGLATPQLSSMSRSLWSQGPLVLLLVLALLERVRWEDGEKQRPVLLGLLLGMGFWVRPSAAVVAAVFAVEIALRRRSALAPLVLAGGACFVAFLVFNYAMIGTPVPLYYRGQFLRNPEPLEAAFGLLFSPSRGLFVFSPFLLIGLLAWLRHGIAGQRRGLGLLSAAAAGAVFCLAALNCSWWGGWSYGPRLLSETVPFLMAISVWGLAAGLRRGGGRRSALGVAALLLLSWSVYTHTAGAWSPANWNRAPYPVDRFPDRVWSWSDPQFLAWTERPRPSRRHWPPEPPQACAPDDSVTTDTPAIQPPKGEGGPRADEPPAR